MDHTVEVIAGYTVLLLHRSRSEKLSELKFIYFRKCTTIISPMSWMVKMVIPFFSLINYKILFTVFLLVEFPFYCVGYIYVSYQFSMCLFLSFAFAFCFSIEMFTLFTQTPNSKPLRVAIGI